MNTPRRNPPPPTASTGARRRPVILPNVQDLIDERARQSAPFVGSRAAQYGRTDDYVGHTRGEQAFNPSAYLPRTESQQVRVEPTTTTPGATTHFPPPPPASVTAPPVTRGRRTIIVAVPPRRRSQELPNQVQQRRSAKLNRFFPQPISHLSRRRLQWILASVSTLCQRTELLTWGILVLRGLLRRCQMRSRGLTFKKTSLVIITSLSPANLPRIKNCILRRVARCTPIHCIDEVNKIARTSATTIPEEDAIVTVPVKTKWIGLNTS
jgi:hypothetical protein